MAGDQQKVEQLTRHAVDHGLTAEQIIQDGFIAAMHVVGQKFGAGEIYIPEMLIAARAMKTGMEIVKPLLVGKNVHSIAKVAIGTVKGDLHDIGKNLVGIMLEGAGFEVIDLGIDVSVNTFVEAVKKDRPRFVAMSALLTTTMDQMKMVVDELQTAGLRDAVKIFVGGAPVSQSFAEKIGADGYGQNAGQAAELMKAMLH
jgi:5-methyltetrahydrofolate--homocysteine methyltransferase